MLGDSTGHLDGTPLAKRFQTHDQEEPVVENGEPWELAGKIGDILLEFSCNVFLLETVDKEGWFDSHDAKTFQAVPGILSRQLINYPGQGLIFLYAVVHEAGVSLEARFSDPAAHLGRRAALARRRLGFDGLADKLTDGNVFVSTLHGRREERSVLALVGEADDVSAMLLFGFGKPSFLLGLGSSLEGRDVSDEVVAHDASSRFGRHSHWLDRDTARVAAMTASRVIFAGAVVSDGNSFACFVFEPVPNIVFFHADGAAGRAEPLDGLVRVRLFAF